MNLPIAAIVLGSLSFALSMYVLHQQLQQSLEREHRFLGVMDDLIKACHDLRETHHEAIALQEQTMNKLVQSHTTAMQFAAHIKRLTETSK